MLNDSNLPGNFWAEEVFTARYILNRILIRPLTNKTSYELFYKKKPKVSYFKIFGSKYFIFNTKDNLDKFDAKYDKGIFVGYSNKSIAYRVFNTRTNTIEETLHVSFDENSKVINNNIDEDNIDKTSEFSNNEFNINEHNDNSGELHPNKRTKVLKDHPVENILGSIESVVKIRNQLNKMINVAFISSVELKNPTEASTNDSWILAMQEELNQFIWNDVRELVPIP